MPNTPERRAAGAPPAGRPATPFYGISLRIALAVFATAILVSLLLSIGDQSIGTAVIVINIIAALGVTLISQPRNLFIVVCCVPITLALSLLFAGAMTAQANGNEGFGLSQIVTAIYPLTQYFPQFMFLTIGCAIIAVLRIYLLRRNSQRKSRNMHKERATQKMQEQRNRQASTKSRRQATNAAHQVTVQDLLERRRNQNKQGSRSGRADASSRSSRPNGGARTYAKRSSHSTNADGASESSAYSKRPRTSSFPVTSSEAASSSTREPRDQAGSSTERGTATSQYNRTRRVSKLDRQNPTHGQVPRPQNSHSPRTSGRSQDNDS